MKPNTPITVRMWINENILLYPHHTVRIINEKTNRGTGTHWLLHADYFVKKVKIVSGYIFLYI